MNDQPHTTLVYLKTRRDEARAEESRVLSAGEPDADVPAIVADTYDTAIALFEEMDRRLRELARDLHMEGFDRPVKGIQAILTEFEGHPQSDGKPREEPEGRDD